MAKDQAGRHGKGTYGNPLRSAPLAAGDDDSAPKERGVTSAQGSRSFGLGRKRAL
jgi:hypothetical protein